MHYLDFKRVYVDKTLTLKNWQGKSHEQANNNITFDVQRFGLKKLPEGNYNLTIRRQVQNRHIEGTSEHRDYAAKLAQKGYKPSLLAKGVNAAELVSEFHKKGIYDPNPKDNSPREIADAGRIIGQYWDSNKGEYVDTTFIEIVYSKHGAHVYPIFYLEEWLK